MPKFNTFAEEEAYYSGRPFALNKISTFNKEGWKRVKEEVRPVMVDYWKRGDWDGLARFWRQVGQRLVEEAIG